MMGLPKTMRRLPERRSMRTANLHTGDQGAIDEGGLITITDRIKEMIKVKGIGVAPAELEDLLLGHEKVEDVAVLGIKDEYSGEIPKAYIVPKPEVKGDEALGLGVDQVCEGEEGEVQGGEGDRVLQCHSQECEWEDIEAGVEGLG